MKEYIAFAEHFALRETAAAAAAVLSRYIASRWLSENDNASFFDARCQSAESNCEKFAKLKSLKNDKFSLPNYSKNARHAEPRLHFHFSVF